MEGSYKCQKISERFVLIMPLDSNVYYIRPNPSDIEGSFALETTAEVDQ